MPSQDPPRISYTATIADTGEQTTRVVDDAGVMLEELEINIALSELAFARDLTVSQPTIDPVTDQLTLTVVWADTMQLYMTIVANKMPDSNQMN